METSTVTFSSTAPVFSAGQRLMAENMNQLNDHLSMLGSAILNRFSDGVIHGLELRKTETNGLVLESGVFKLNGKIGALDKPLSIPSDFDETQALILREKEDGQQMAPGNISTVPECVPVANITVYSLSWMPPQNSDCLHLYEGMELGRVRRIKDLPLKDYYQNNRLSFSRIEDILHIRRSLEIGDILLLYVPYSCSGKYPTLGNKIQEAIADYIAAQNLNTFNYMLSSLFRGDFPVCHFTGVNNLYLAALGLYQKLTATSNAISPPAMIKGDIESHGPITLD